jgi:hypothetical protein
MELEELYYVGWTDGIGIRVLADTMASAFDRTWRQPRQNEIHFAKESRQAACTRGSVCSGGARKMENRPFDYHLAAGARESDPKVIGEMERALSQIFT